MIVADVLVFVAERPDTGPDVMLLRLEGDERSGWKPGNGAGHDAVDIQEGKP